MKVYIICSVFLVQLFLVTFAFRTQFYYNADFTELVYEISPTDKCATFPKYINAMSIATDVCVVAYNFPNCHSSDWKEKYRNFTVNSQHFIYQSFQICSEEQNDPQLNIDLTKHFLTNERDPPALKRYKDVCDCVDIRPIIQNLDKWSINSNGNDFVAYFEPNCSESKWSAKHFELGTKDTADMHSHFKMDRETNETYKIQSIGPDPNSKYYKTRCIRKINQNFITELRDKEIYHNVSSLISDLESKYAKTHQEIENFKNNFNRQFKNLNEGTDLVLGQNIQLQIKLQESMQNFEVMQDKMEATVKKLENIAEQSKNTLKLFEEKLEKQKDDIQAICA